MVPGAAKLVVRKASALTATRTYAVGAVLMWIVFGAVLAVLNHDLHPIKGDLGVAAFGLLDLFWIAALARRPLPNADPKSVRAFFAQTFFICFAISMSIVGLGFIAFFISGRGQLLLYLTSIPFASAGLVMVAPTKRRLERMQIRLKELGSAESIVSVLNQPPEPVIRKPRKPRGPRGKG
jgi:hypothetical protein